MPFGQKNKVCGFKFKVPASFNEFGPEVFFIAKRYTVFVRAGRPDKSSAVVGVSLRLI
jgi:hypothetical protein